MVNDATIKSLRELLEKLDRRARPPITGDAADVAELRAKLHAAHRELMRRHRRDQELARQLPAIVGQLQVLAADAALDVRTDPPVEDPDVDWTGIEGGDR
jgi:hypothetical protein